MEPSRPSQGSGDSSSYWWSSIEEYINIQHDIILLPVHPRPNQPIFLAYYEEHEFIAGHYQAMEPVTKGPVVKDILLKGGGDISFNVKL